MGLLIRLSSFIAGLKGMRVDCNSLEIGGTLVTSSAAELNILDGVTATYTEINNACDVSGRLVAAGGTLAVTSAHEGKTIMLDRATGSTCTLPAATGSGAVYRFAVKALATSNNHIVKVANANDVMCGTILAVDTDSAGTITGYATAATSDTITLNRSTTGSVTIGEWVEVCDILANKWAVRGVVSNSGDGATPFSAAVS